MNNSESNPNIPDSREDEETEEIYYTESVDILEEPIDKTENTIQPELDSKINDIIQPDVDEEILFPTYKLFRNQNHDIEILKYQPGDLITLILENTGKSRSTEIVMYDSRDEPRYHGKSGGNNHEWTTRIQRTTILGNWRFTAQGPFIDENNLFSLDIPFEIVKYIPEEVPLIEEEVIVEGDYEELINFAINENVNIPVIEIKGVGPSYQQRMNNADIYYFHEILQSNPETLSEKTSVNLMKIEMWFAFVEKTLGNRGHQLVLQYSSIAGEPDKGGEVPSAIKGIGPVMEKKLLTAGFNNVLSIADSSPQNIVDGIHITITKAQTWINNAQMIISGTADIQKQKPIKPATEIKLTPSDPPEKITGVGPATSKKLVSAGFTTIQNIADANLDELAAAINSEKRAVKVLNGAKQILSSLKV
ncbi:MAG: helix-hairpin-helix domain-containing protein [Candidatus Kariarchaeaceae archaeon]|jgi:predicted flap endonuclease-1-like 5' DNA nuclease